VPKLDFDLGAEHETSERLANAPLVTAERARDRGCGHVLSARREQLTNPRYVGASDIGERGNRPGRGVHAALNECGNPGWLDRHGGTANAAVSRQINPSLLNP
jgi:hypothetical protein